MGYLPTSTGERQDFWLPSTVSFPFQGGFFSGTFGQVPSHRPAFDRTELLVFGKTSCKGSTSQTQGLVELVNFLFDLYRQLSLVKHHG